VYKEERAWCLGEISDVWNSENPWFLHSSVCKACKVVFFLPQLRGPATALSRKVLHEEFQKFFVICIIIFAMKIEKFQLRGNNSMCAEAFQLLRGRAPAQLRGNIGGMPSACGARCLVHVLSIDIVN
jgi:hypothetical protein